jgi:large subunit ribosomal protein L17
LAKKDTVHARRLAFRRLHQKKIVKLLFDEIAPEYMDRPGGYTRVIKLGQRSGDGARMAILELVGFDTASKKKKQKDKEKEAKTEGKKKKKSKEKEAVEETEVKTEDKKKKSGKKSEVKAEAKEKDEPNAEAKSKGKGKSKDKGKKYPLFL